MDRRNAGGDLHFLQLAPWRMTVNNRGLTPAAPTPTAGRPAEYIDYRPDFLGVHGVD